MKCSFFLLYEIDGFCHTVRQAFTDPHLSVCAAELHFSVVNSFPFATSTWLFQLDASIPHVSHNNKVSLFLQDGSFYPLRRSFPFTNSVL